MSELNTTPAPTPETDKATVTTDWMTGKPVVPADFARRLERERDEAREREKSLLLRLGQEKDHSEHVMARLNDSDTLRLAMFADLTTLRAVADEMEKAISDWLKHCEIIDCGYPPSFDAAITRYADLKKENIQRSETGEARSL